LHKADLTVGPYKRTSLTQAPVDLALALFVTCLVTPIHSLARFLGAPVHLRALLSEKIARSGGQADTRRAI
jgi:hypothetical protein